MKLNFVSLAKEEIWRILSVVLSLELLLFLLPTNGKVEGAATGYWDGVKLRLLSGGFWGIALLGGLGAAAILIALFNLSGYLAKFVKPSSDGNEAGSPRKSD